MCPKAQRLTALGKAESGDEARLSLYLSPAAQLQAGGRGCLARCLDLSDALVPL